VHEQREPEGVNMGDYGAPPVSDSAREQVRVLGIARAVIGSAMVLAPATSMRFWIGEERKAFGTRLITRAFGMREIAIGVGTVLAVDHDAPVRGWLEAGVLIDSSDALTTLLSYRRLPRVGRTLVLAGATTAAVMGARLARQLG
jgi:hypothetical protein